MILEKLLHVKLKKNDYLSLLEFHNTSKLVSKKNKAAIFCTLLCLRALIGQAKSHRISNDILAYADPILLVNMFTQNKKCQQYFIEALCQLKDIEELLEKNAILALSRTLGIENNDFIKQIKQTVEKNGITSIIDEGNIKDIIKILQIPRVDTKSIEEIRHTIKELLYQCRNIDEDNSPKIKAAGMSVLSLLSSLAGAGIEVGCYFLVKGHSITGIRMLGAIPYNKNSDPKSFNEKSPLLSVNNDGKQIQKNNCITM